MESRSLHELCQRVKQQIFTFSLFLSRGCHSERLKAIKGWSECLIGVVFLWILTFFVEIKKNITKKTLELPSFQVFLWYFLSFCTRRVSNLWFSSVVDILWVLWKLLSFLWYCPLYAVKDAVLILGTILKCYYQMKAIKLYFPTSEVVRRLSYLIVCVVNPEVWLIKTNLLSTMYLSVVLIALQYKMVL